MNAENINIAMILDENYLFCTLISLFSMKKNKNKDSVYNVYIFTYNTVQISNKFLAKMGDENFNVHIIPINNNKYQNIRKSNHVTGTALIKFDLPTLLLQLDKILYIDGDTIIQNDLSELYNIDLDDYYLAASYDLRAEKMGFNKLVNKERYINSGVMLLNLTKMRNENIMSKLIDAKLNQPKTWLCQDQDAINYVCGKNIKYLDIKYNSCCPLLIMSNISIEEINKCYNTKYPNFDKLADSSIILHYAGVLKPWDSEIPYSALYKAYISQYNAANSNS